MDLITSPDPRIQIFEHLREKEISQSKVARHLGIASQTLHNILRARHPLSDERLKQINTYLGVEFPLTETLPHEQLAIDRESLKEKPLFKDE